ncbi:MAG: carbohydrate kinase [Actinomyces sp.]|jgi:L-xylulokinase|nr:FGGY-family carbohydrate kinase [Actinomyces sp.]MCI1641570.1 carbohydrate kinase [Actinomyces sp.]MCI1787633.1 carbohydrate kinase [Actinomyces sp.]MCI1830159.1 carbohydrate kinase [Actinomyces sp.]MCI1867406.1 carbohydrate kinase [Actinomyces sp.]
MTQYILGIDNGGTVSKAALYSVGGELIALATESVPPVLTQAGWSERDMEDLWTANVGAIRAVVEDGGIDPADVAAVTVTGHGNGLYLVGPDGAPVRNGIISNDSRAQDIVDRWTSDGSYTETFLDSTMQSLFPGAPLALLAWLSEHEPDSVERARHIFMVKDYIRFRLTGVPAFEITDASCTNFLDMRTRTLDATGLGRMGLGAWSDKLPPLVGSGDVAGRIRADVAQQVGLRAGTPVLGGVSDISASAIGAGAVRDHQLSVVTGTWSINEYFTPDPVVDERLFMTSLAPMPGRYLVMEASPTSAANLEWFVSNVLRPLPGMESLSNKELFRLCDAMVFAPGADSRQVSYLPMVFGSNLHPGGLGGWTNVSNADGITQLLRSLYEGVAFSHKEHIERLRGYGALAGRARLTGGVTKSPEWSQLLVDVLGLDLETVPVAESGVLGAVVAAAAALGAYPSVVEAAEAMVPSGRTITHSPEATKAYAAKFDAWLRCLDRLCR